MCILKRSTYIHISMHVYRFHACKLLHLYIYIYIYIYIMHTCMYTSYTYISRDVNIYTYETRYVCMYVWLYEYVNACFYFCMKMLASASHITKQWAVSIVKSRSEIVIYIQMDAKSNETIPTIHCVSSQDFDMWAEKNVRIIQNNLRKYIS